jgi:hypothetical protein
VHTICEKKFIKTNEKRLFDGGDLSMMVPMGILKKNIGKKVKKYMRLNSIVVKL